MKSETVKLAENIFANVMSTATNLGQLTDEEQDELFQIGAAICIRAARAFEKELEKTTGKDIYG